MLKESKELVEKFPDLYRSYDDPNEAPDTIRGYDGTCLMGLYLAVFDLFCELVESGNEPRAHELLSYAKEKLYADRSNWPSDLSTAIILGVFENFGHDEVLWKNLNKWFSKSEYLMFHEAFDYLLEHNERDILRKLYP
jgi:hypothetical protein